MLVPVLPGGGCGRMRAANRLMCNMQIQLNGTPTDIPDALSARELLDRLELAGRRVALEVNGEIVPRSTHSGYRFHSDDKVEIVHAIGGGKKASAEFRMLRSKLNTQH